MLDLIWLAMHYEERFNAPHQKSIWGFSDRLNGTHSDCLLGDLKEATIIDIKTTKLWPKFFFDTNRLDWDYNPFIPKGSFDVIITLSPLYFFGNLNWRTVDQRTTNIIFFIYCDLFYLPKNWAWLYLNANSRFLTAWPNHLYIPKIWCVIFEGWGAHKMARHPPCWKRPCMNPSHPSRPVATNHVLIILVLFFSEHLLKNICWGIVN